MRHVNIAITGFGQVGKAVASLLLQRRARYQALYDLDVRLAAAFGSKAGAVAADGLDEAWLGSAEMTPGMTGVERFASAPVDVLVEAGPTDFRDGGPGLAYMRAALIAGRHVIAISKGALVADWPALREAARRNHVQLRVSGATAAALPTIDLLEHSLLGCQVMEIEGILNATSNHLLTAMMARDLDLATALAQAQEQGFVERDPILDIEGWDTACKLQILMTFGLGLDLKIGDLAVQGIQDVTPADLRDWRHASVVPKLVGYLRRTEDGVHAGVEVRTYPATDVFGLVTGTTKAIRLRTDRMGETVAISQGAEPAATAAAALKDLEHILASESARPNA